MNFYSKQKRYLEDMCLLNFKVKSSILLAATVSLSLQAQDYKVEDILPQKTQSKIIEKNPFDSVDTKNTPQADQVSNPIEESSESDDTLVTEQVSNPIEEVSDTEDTLVDNHALQPNNMDNTSSPTCPAQFYTLPLFPNAKFCQLFAEELPASMSYFATSDQLSAKDFYISQLGQAEDEKLLNGRIVLQYSNGQKVVVISKDGQGSQIDILVKSAG